MAYVAEQPPVVSTGSIAPPKPVACACPVCGSLECLCRPRFFAGQLLSEEDLRALDHYIIEKNKLHNRCLHGWGVACGLQVVEHACPGWVTIKTGYALDPCGNDIIVCHDYSFDLCAAIRKACSQLRNTAECQPLVAAPPDCADQNPYWHIKICYSERESRGLTALKNPAPSHSCGCGGSGCSCGCGGSGAALAATCSCGQASSASPTRGVTPSPSLPAPQCEPTRICEGFVVKVEPTTEYAENSTSDVLAGTFLGQVAECLKEQGKSSYAGAFYEKKESYLDCFCNSILPPCPSAVGDPCVVLARIKLEPNDGSNQPCTFTICNLSGRRILLTWPNVYYWMSFGGVVKWLLERLCCGDSTTQAPAPPPQNPIQ